MLITQTCAKVIPDQQSLQGRSLWCDTMGPRDHAVILSLEDNIISVVQQVGCLHDSRRSLSSHYAFIKHALPKHSLRIANQSLKIDPQSYNWCYAVILGSCTNHLVQNPGHPSFVRRSWSHGTMPLLAKMQHYIICLASTSCN